MAFDLHNSQHFAAEMEILNFTLSEIIIWILKQNYFPSPFSMVHHSKNMQTKYNEVMPSLVHCIECEHAALFYQASINSEMDISK